MINNPKDSVTFSGITVNLVNTELLDGENKLYEVQNNTDKVRVTVVRESVASDTPTPARCLVPSSLLSPRLSDKGR